MKENTRFYLVDAIRGILIILVVLFHLIFDLNMYNIIDFDLTILFFEVAKAIVVALFCIISGIAQNLSQNSLKRSVKLILVAYIVTLVTFLFNKNSYVLFGILHCLGFSALIYALIKRYIDNLFGRITPVIWAVLFVVLSFIELPYVNIPHLYMFGFMQHGFSSSDYYPLLPWLFAFLLGTSLAKFIIKNKLPIKFYTIRLNPFELIGRHTLIIYLLHQPIFIAVLTLIK